MKVTDINHVLTDNKERYVAADRQTAAGRDTAFFRQLTTLNETQYHRYLADLQEKIYKQGEKIKEKADIKALQEYRMLIGELLGETASNAFACIKSNVFDARGRHKVFLVIRSVNQKLEELAREILSDQRDNIRLLQMVDDIRGMLVDLFL